MTERLKKKVLIIGAGIAGLEAAVQLMNLNYDVEVIEKENFYGGHVKQWFKTFPDFQDTKPLIDLIAGKPDNLNIHFGSVPGFAEEQNGIFHVITDKNLHIHADAVLISTGFELFDAHRKEEYGYGIFNHVITNADLESFFQNGFPETGKLSLRFGFIHCVGSRDAKAGNLYCSKVCCATAVKQAIEVRQHFPDSEVYCFYMDMRMFGKQYEELFQQAQEKYGIHFVRARLSEVNQNFDQSLLIKVEDTLTSKPMKMSLDYIVLMSGMEPSVSSQSIATLFGIALDNEGFIKVSKPFIAENITEKKGLFVAGTATGPKTITETLNDARSAALAVHQYLNSK